MSSTLLDRPTITLYPSPQKDVEAYKAAIRLAASVRNSMDAEKAGVASGEGVAVEADSYGRHHPSPPSVDPATAEGPKSVPVLNHTSANFNWNITKPGFVPSRDSYPSSSHSVDTGRLLIHEGNTSTTANVSFLAEASTLEAIKKNDGNPPPHPPIGATPAPPERSVSRRTEAIPIDLEQGPLPAKLNFTGGALPQCQLYVTNTDVNITFTVCPITKRNSNLTHNIESRQLHSGDASNSNILTIRNTPMCEAPTGFNQRVACGQYDGYFVLAFFILFSVIGLAWMKIRKQRSQRLDEENIDATWPGTLHVSTNSSAAKLKEIVRKSHQEDHHVNEEPSTEQYETVAWRSKTQRAARTNLQGKVEHDAGPLAVLPTMFP